MARKLRIRVDHDVCVGNAMCETIAPKVFRLNENRQSEAVDPAGDTVEKILEAAENCPVSAIFVEDAETGEQLCPYTIGLARMSSPIVVGDSLIVSSL